MRYTKKYVGRPERVTKLYDSTAKGVFAGTYDGVDAVGHVISELYDGEPEYVSIWDADQAARKAYIKAEAEWDKLIENELHDQVTIKLARAVIRYTQGRITARKNREAKRTARAKVQQHHNVVNISRNQRRRAS